MRNCLGTNLSRSHRNMYLKFECKNNLSNLLPNSTILNHFAALFNIKK